MMAPRSKNANLLTSVLTCLAAFLGPASASVQISADKTMNIRCSGGICVPTARFANLNVKRLQRMLARSDVKVVTANVAITIGVLSPLTWASRHRLTLDAKQSVNILAPVVVTGTGGMTLTTNEGGTGGVLSFGSSGSISFWDLASNLMINGQTYTLAGNVFTLADDIAENPFGSYALAKTYDASVDGTYQHSPVPTSFLGTFEGLGNTIDNLSINVPGGISAFGFFTQSSGTIRDIRVSNLSYFAQSDGNTTHAGGLVEENDGVISGASTSGNVQGDILDAGGLVNVNKGTIANSSSNVDGDISCGLAVENDATISQSFALASMSGVDAGGLVCYNMKTGTISESYATGNLTGIATHPPYYGNVGGLVAVNYGAITRSFATGAAIGMPGNQATAGGLVGNDLGGGSIAQSYATGAVQIGQKAAAGGLIGKVGAKAAVTQVYSIGTVETDQLAIVGGLMGWDKSEGARVASAYWDLDTSGVTDPSQGAGYPQNDPGITGLTNSQLKSRMPDGFDPKVWAQHPRINGGYPYLRANPPPQ